MQHKTTFALGSLTSSATGPKIQIKKNRDARADNFLNLASSVDSKSQVADLQKISQLTSQSTSHQSADELPPALECQGYNTLDLIRIKTQQLAKAAAAAEADDNSDNLYPLFAKKNKVKGKEDKGKAKRVDDVEAKAKVEVEAEHHGEERQFADAIAARIELVAMQNKKAAAASANDEDKDEEEKKEWLTIIADITHDSFVAADLPNLHRDFRRRIATYDSGYRDGELKENVNGLTNFTSLTKRNKSAVTTINQNDNNNNNTRLVSCWCCRAVEGLMSPWNPRNPEANCSIPFIIPQPLSTKEDDDDKTIERKFVDKLVEFKWCSGCGVVAYCGADCRLADDKIHKSICSPTLASHTATSKRSRATFLRKETDRGTSIFFSSLTPLTRKSASSINPLSKESLLKTARPTIKMMPPKLVQGVLNEKNSSMNKRRKVDEANYNLTNNYNSVMNDMLPSTYRWRAKQDVHDRHSKLYHWKIASARKEIIVLE